MSQGMNARHRRHVERARQQGRADGPATLTAMSRVYTMARVQRLEHVHDDTCIIVGESGRRWCSETDRYL